VTEPQDHSKRSALSCGSNSSVLSVLPLFA
jgi:hypothetical protein